MITVYLFSPALSNPKKLLEDIGCSYTQRLSVNNGEQNGKVVADASGNGENVPDGMKIFHLLYCVKDNANRIKHTASDEQPKAPRVHDPQQRADGNDNNPTHRDVADNRGLAEFFKVDRIEHNADDCRSPDNTEQHPSDGAAQNGNRDRCVGSRDEKKYRIVIHDTEEALCSRIGNRMVQRAHTIQYNQACTENSTADH